MITKRIIAARRARRSRRQGVQFVDLVDAGDQPTSRASRREGATRLCCSTLRTLEGRQTLLDTVRRTGVSYSFPSASARHSYADDAAQVFEAGADKVSVNSARCRSNIDRCHCRSFGAGRCRRHRCAPRPEAADRAHAQSSSRAGATGRAPRSRVGARAEARARANPAHLHELRRTRTGFDCELTAR